MIIKTNNITNSNIFKIFPLIIFIFNPKIDIIYISGYWQGIRLDDLIVLMYLIFFFFYNKGKIFPNLISQKEKGFNFIIFFPYLLLSTLIGNFFTPPNFNIEWIIPLRYLEYIGLIVVINKLDIPIKTIIVLIKAYIIINFTVVMFQYFDLLGAISSRGFSPNLLENPELSQKIATEKYDGFFKDVYIPAGGIALNRAPGITGGPWELTTNLSICIFALYVYSRNIFKVLPYFLLSLLMMFIAQSRGIIFGFIVGLIFLIKDPKKIIKFVILLTIISVLLYYLNLFNFSKFIHDKFFINYFELSKLFIGSITGNIAPEINYSGTGLESMWYRATSWNEQIAKLQSHWLLPIFGFGGDQIYSESLIIKIITCYGILGLFIILYLSRNLSLYFLMFCTVTGLTLDLFVSFKIFLFAYLLNLINQKYYKFS